MLYIKQRFLSIYFDFHANVVNVANIVKLINFLFISHLAYKSILQYNQNKIKMDLADFHDENDRHLYDDDSYYGDDYDSHYGDEDGDEDVMDDYMIEMSQLNDCFMDSEKKNGQHVIGLCDYLHDNVYCSGVTSNVFFKYSHNQVIIYLFHNSVTRIYYDPKIDIIQLSINNDDVYLAIRKTYWIKLIQRHWKKMCVKKQNMINKRMSMSNQFAFETTGKYKKGYNVINLRIKGLLNCYSNSKK